MDKLNATLCFNVADEQLYSEIYPILEEQDLTGIIILRNDQLPGDKYAIPVQDFLNLLQAGWNSAISLSRPQGESDEAWKSRVQTYMQKLQKRTGIKTKIYCFPEGACSEPEAKILEELGFETVLCHKLNDSLDSENLKIIKLYPYHAKALRKFLTKTDGYCGVEVWVDWIDDTPKNLRYHEDTLRDLLSSDVIQIDSLDELEKQTATAFEELPDGDEGTARDRLAEIEDQLERLYQ